MSEFFKNTFGKDDSQHNLQYDNTAFLYFLISISATISLMLVYLIIKQVNKGGKSRKQYELVKNNPLFKEKAKIVNKLLPSVYSSGGFIFKVLVLGLLISLSVMAYQTAITSDTVLKGFDPYQLLGVDYNTELPQIKKAYRKLALELHPDRNPNNPEAAAKFIFVSKAYECLTDEAAKQKCLKFGNPDGSESFNVGIALPSFLVELEYQAYVIITMFIILLLVIPKAFLNWNSKFQTQDGRGVLVSNYYLLYRMFVCDLGYPNIMKTLSQMKQVENPKFNKVIADSEEEQNVEQTAIPQGSAGLGHEDHVAGCCGQDHDDQQHGIQQQQQYKGLTTAQAYEQFKKTLVPVPQTQGSIRNLAVVQKYIEKQILYDKFLQQIPNLLKSLIYFSLDFCTSSMKKKKTLFQDNPNLVIPCFGTNSYHQILNISKDFYQNSQTSESGLQNLTLTSQQILVLQQQGFTIRKLVTDKDIKDQFLQRVTKSQTKDLFRRQIQLMPALQMNVQTLAGDFPETVFTDRDIINFKFVITKNATDGVAFLPRYGYLKKQKFYFTLQVSSELMHFQQVIFQPGQTQITIQYSYRQRSASELTFLAILRSDCYFGLDIGKQIPLKFIPYNGPQKIIFNKQDIHVERIPRGYFEQMMTLQTQNPQDDQLSQTADDDNNQNILQEIHQNQAHLMQKLIDE